MIDPKDVAAYRQIKAPDALKQRVMESAKLRTEPIKLNRPRAKMLGAVACLAILCVAAFFVARPAHGPKVLYEGELLSARATTLAPATAAKAVPFGGKMVTPSGIPLEIKLSKETKISVSAGELQVYASDSGELLFVGTDLTADRDLNLRWDLSGVENNALELTLSDKNHQATYAINLDSAGNAVIYQKK